MIVNAVVAVVAHQHQITEVGGPAVGPELHVVGEATVGASPAPNALLVR